MLVNPVDKVVDSISMVADSVGIALTKANRHLTIKLNLLMGVGVVASSSVKPVVDLPVIIPHNSHSLTLHTLDTIKFKQIPRCDVVSIKTKFNVMQWGRVKAARASVDWQLHSNAQKFADSRMMQQFEELVAMDLDSDIISESEARKLVANMRKSILCKEICRC